MAVVVGLRRVDDGLDDRLVVVVGVEERTTESGLVELVLDLVERALDVGVFLAGHQMRRLDHDLLHAVIDALLQRIVDVVDRAAVTALELVDDDLRGECATYVVVGECLPDVALDGADGNLAAVVVARAEARHQDDRLRALLRVVTTCAPCESGDCCDSCDCRCSYESTPRNLAGHAKPPHSLPALCRLQSYEFG